MLIRKYRLEIIIIIIGIIISISLIIQNQSEKNDIFNTNTNDVEILSPVDISKDLIRGNPIPNRFYIVEYIDLQCPFCQEFHPEIKRYISDTPYVLSGDVSWVVRHGPHIDKLSTQKAEFTECVRHIEDDVDVWNFIDNAIKTTAETTFPYERYENILNSLGLRSEEILSCFDKRVKRDILKDARKNVETLNITQTPFLQFITPNGELLNEYAGVVTTKDLIDFTESYIQP